MMRFSISDSAAYGPRALDIRDRTAVAQALIVTQNPIETIVREDNFATAMVWRRTSAKSCGGRNMSRASRSHGKEPAADASSIKRRIG
jgi:hypothetical protein